MKRFQKIILGSGSPRRKQLLADLGYDFEVRVSDADESAPNHLSAEETVEWVARSKAQALRETLVDDELLITADTEVWKKNRRYGKPANRESAVEMLRSLSGTSHQVISGICLCNRELLHTFHVTTEVAFVELSEEMISHYVDTYQPFDKAGAYGIQEWIGMVGIAELSGSYYNVVGLPTTEVFEAIQNWPELA
ncbi:Maf family nucleotide pyrophosphatase [Phaeocystidibacter marisrubri]|uniref:dTTP/UTP pyrophosphatase n=1 Tax=Phaeocystidibacter marisrubri TaxID=1577780 RepID=A0A6L3ZLY6_9FLAO|nr:Maf family nucleotide pyrophosphatase [Phaeocystidibacter marisrubri]KAB2818180.1 septum formation protein Maf [Phaeocystidibacter marisrubri]GGH71534.1 Maf-like protein [Phaeocystidibacter marisrubri]